MSKKIVHYINQFFGQIGGEEKADTAPFVKEEPVGPGTALNGQLGDEGEIVATIICGDDYFSSNTEEAKEEIRKVLRDYDPDLVITGPAFNAGRYGTAAGGVAELAATEFELPVVSGMYPENPGVDMYKKYAYIIETSDSAAGMRKAAPAIAELSKKILRGEELGTPKEEGYIPRGIRKNVFFEERGSKRGVDMLVKKLNQEKFDTEYPMPDFDRVDPQPAIKDMANAKIALVTSGGIVPKGNPDGIESSSASKYGKYELKGMDTLTAESHETAHGGYDPTYANENPNRVLPLDAARKLEQEGRIAELHEYFYSTVGNGTSVGNAQQYAAEIAEDLKNHGVDAVIQTST